MKSSTGIVMQLNKQHAFIMTSNGEFLKLKLSKNLPKLGEEYTGEVAKDTPFYKYALTAASLAFLVFFSSTAYAYYTPVASVVVNINPSIKLDLNKWNRIIKSTPLNQDGEKVLSELKVKNKSLNDGLDSIVIQAKKDNFINSDYIESGKTITIDIDSNKPIKNFDLSKFEEKIKLGNINLKITTKENNKTYDKLDISTPHDTKPNKSEKDTNPNNNNNNNNNYNNNNNKQEPNSNEPSKNKNENKHDKSKINKNNSSSLFPFNNNLTDFSKNTTTNTKNIYSKDDTMNQSNEKQNNSDNKENAGNDSNKKANHKN